MTTVNAITTRPNCSDLKNEVSKSPTNCSPNKAKNQWIENPFIGKVNPPFGPWKDKITIAEMGPYKNSTNSPKKEANQ